MTLERVDCWCDVLSSRNVCNGDIDAELACLIMSIAYFKRNLGVVSIGDDGQVTHVWDHLPQYFEPLVEQITRLVRQSSDVATWSGERSDQTASDWVRRHRKNNRNNRGGAFGRRNGNSSQDNNIDVEPNELSYDLIEALAAAFRPAILDRDCLALDPAKLAQPLYKGS